MTALFARAAAYLVALDGLSPDTLARLLMERHGYGAASKWAQDLVAAIERMRK